jgi:hypothetical protein
MTSSTVTRSRPLFPLLLRIVQGFVIAGLYLNALASTSNTLIHVYVAIAIWTTVTLAGFIRWVAFATGETTISVRGGGIASVGMETPREVRDAIRNAVHSRILGRVPDRNALRQWSGKDTRCGPQATMRLTSDTIELRVDRSCGQGVDEGVGLLKDLKFVRIERGMNFLWVIVSCIGSFSMFSTSYQTQDICVGCVIWLIIPFIMIIGYLFYRRGRLIIGFGGGRSKMCRAICVGRSSKTPFAIRFYPSDTDFVSIAEAIQQQAALARQAFESGTVAVPVMISAAGHPHLPPMAVQMVPTHTHGADSTSVLNPLDQSAYSKV